jgi:hypothetical protein
MSFKHIGLSHSPEMLEHSQLKLTDPRKIRAPCSHRRRESVRHFSERQSEFHHQSESRALCEAAPALNLR